jgi:hypothetical protein
MSIMIRESAAMAEMQYRQERFLAEAEAHRLARQAQAGKRDAAASAPARKIRFLSARRRRRAEPAADSGGPELVTERRAA